MVLASWQPLTSNEPAAIAHYSDMVTMISQTISRQNYTASEISFAADQILIDPEVDKKRNFDNAITAADFERHVRRIRRLRILLETDLREYQVTELLIEFYGELSRADFTYRHEDKQGYKLYRYAPGTKEQPGAGSYPQIVETRPATYETRTNAGQPVMINVVLDQMEAERQKNLAKK